MAEPWWEAFIRTHACSPAVAYVKQFPTFAEFWNTCPRGDWLMWIAARLVWDRRHLVLAAVDCFRLVLPKLKPADQPKVQVVLDIAERWGRKSLVIKIKDINAAADRSSDYTNAITDMLLGLTKQTEDEIHAVLNAATTASNVASMVIGFIDKDENVGLGLTADIVRRYYVPVDNAVMELKTVG